MLSNKLSYLYLIFTNIISIIVIITYINNLYNQLIYSYIITCFNTLLFYNRYISLNWIYILILIDLNIKELLLIYLYVVYFTNMYKIQIQKNNKKLVLIELNNSCIICSKKYYINFTHNFINKFCNYCGNYILNKNKILICKCTKNLTDPIIYINYDIINNIQNLLIININKKYKNDLLQELYKLYLKKDMTKITQIIIEFKTNKRIQWL